MLPLISIQALQKHSTQQDAHASSVVAQLRTAQALLAQHKAESAQQLSELREQLALKQQQHLSDTASVTTMMQDVAFVVGSSTLTPALSTAPTAGAWPGLLADLRRQLRKTPSSQRGVQTDPVVAVVDRERGAEIQRLRATLASHEARDTEQSRRLGLLEAQLRQKGAALDDVLARAALLEARLEYVTAAKTAFRVESERAYLALLKKASQATVGRLPAAR